MERQQLPLFELREISVLPVASSGERLLRFEKNKSSICLCVLLVVETDVNSPSPELEVIGSGVFKTPLKAFDALLLAQITLDKKLKIAIFIASLFPSN